MRFDLPEFLPQGIWRNGDIQSLVSSFPLRRPFVERRSKRLSSMSRVEILQCTDGVRLKCLRAMQPVPAAPVAVLIHGWLGSAESLYMLSASNELYDAGFEVWRLQMRDHGDSHDLNQGLFHSCRLDEVIDAIRVIQQRCAGRKLCLGGFSLGANFVLRVAAQADDLNLAQVLAVCPVLHPPATLDALERGPRIYNQYFMRKWRRALRLKHRSWPEHYEIDEIEQKESMRDLTAHLVTRYSDFENLDTYLHGYSIVGDRLATLRTPSVVLAARDDPIIPVADIDQLATPESLTIHITEFGGHCGYLTSPAKASWADQLMVSLFKAANGIELQEGTATARSNAA